ncbi:MAG: gamma subclass chorismate mutase AroQ [Oligoflexales bacterium]
MKFSTLLTLFISLAQPFTAIYGSSHTSLSKSNKTEQVAIEILDTMAERLRIMPEVAKWKAINNKPIDDFERENQLLKKLEKQGADLGLEAEFIRTFFQAQFDAAKIYQRQFIEANRTKSDFDSVQDLNNEIRPKVTQLTNRILNLLSDLKKSGLSPKEIKGLVDQNSGLLYGFDDEVVKKSLEAFNS